MSKTIITTVFKASYYPTYLVGDESSPSHRIYVRERITKEGKVSVTLTYNIGEERKLFIEDESLDVLLKKAQGIVTGWKL